MMGKSFKLQECRGACRHRRRQPLKTTRVAQHAQALCGQTSYINRWHGLSASLFVSLIFG